MAKSASQVAQKWAQRLSNSTEAIKQGIQAVTVSPTEKAAAQSQRYLEGITRAVTTGKWQASLRAVSLDQWRRAILEKGVNRIATGAQAAIPKMEKFMQEFLPYVAGVQQELESMPRGDFEQNIQRMLFNARKLHEFKKS
jgi:hypothetical protein